MGNEKMCLRNRISNLYSSKKKINEISMYKTISDHSIKSSDVVETFY